LEQREPVRYSLAQVTQYFTKSLSQAGFIIVSGMALGVDSVAHQAALSEGGKTVAILGCGVQIVYPPSNRKLYEKILEKGNIVISEFPPYMTVKPGLFISRNRLVSALSKAVLVTEGLRESGSLITARFASEQGKDVFATPGSIFSDQSQAPHFLIKRGACLVSSPQEIYEELGMRNTSTADFSELSLSLDEKELVTFLQSTPSDVDEISTNIKIPVYEVMSLLSSLEIQGVVEKNELGKYQIKR
jgi:DNA processing protein